MGISRRAFMSTRVYLSQHTYQTTHEEATLVGLRIQRSRATVQELHCRRQHAYQRDEVRVVRRPTVWRDLLGHHVPVAGLSARWHRSPSWLYPWRQALLRRGMDSVVSHPSGGRRPQWTPRPKKRVVELREAGPQVVGGETACGTAGLMRVLLWRECGGLDHGQSVCPWLRPLGLSLHKARLVAAHRDTARRHAWLQEAWPMLGRAAQRRQGLLLLEEEARLAPWGSFRSPWARRGQPPEGKTSGQRTGYQGFGAMEYVSGRLCSQGLAGRLASDSSHAFVRTLLAHPTAHLCLLPEGARSPTRQATTPCFGPACRTPHGASVAVVFASLPSHCIPVEA